MSDRANQTYSGLVALLVAAVILLIMFSITEAAASHGHLSGTSWERVVLDHNWPWRGPSEQRGGRS